MNARQRHEFDQIEQAIDRDIERLDILAKKEPLEFTMETGRDLFAEIEKIGKRLDRRYEKMSAVLSIN